MRGASRTSLAQMRERLGEALQRGTDSPQELADALFALVRLLSREGVLRRTLSDPATPIDAKRRLIEGLFRERVSDAIVGLLLGAAGLRWSSTADFVDAIETLGVQTLFTIAENEDSLDDVEDELFRFGRVVERESRLRSLLSNARIPNDAKRDFVAGLLGERVNPITQRLIDEMVLSPRGRTLDRALDDLARQAAERRQQLIAAVKVPVPMSDEQSDKLAETLREVYGRGVRLQVELDPDLVGGFVVHIGDEVIDASVGRRLAEVARQFNR